MDFIYLQYFVWLFICCSLRCRSIIIYTYLLSLAFILASFAFTSVSGNKLPRYFVLGVFWHKQTFFYNKVASLFDLILHWSYGLCGELIDGKREWSDNKRGEMCADTNLMVVAGLEPGMDPLSHDLTQIIWWLVFQFILTSTTNRKPAQPKHIPLLRKQTRSLLGRWQFEKITEFYQM